MKNMFKLTQSKGFVCGSSSSLLLLISVFIANISMDGICWLLIYQPKVPKSLLKI